MKTNLLFFLTLIAGLAVSHAENATGTLMSVDLVKQSFTLAAAGEVRVFRARPSSEITVNGNKVTFDKLAAGMAVKLVTSEPGLAAKVTATVLAPGAAPAPVAGVGAAKTSKNATALEHNLGGTKWTWADAQGRPGNVFVIFNKGGTGYFSDSANSPTTWKVLDQHTVLWGGSKHFVFTDDLTAVTCADWTPVPFSGKRVP